MNLLNARIAWAFVGALALVGCPQAAPSDGGADASDASADRGDVPVPDVPVRNDRLNMNCTSAAGDEDAVPCNQRLMATESGASWFVGGRSQCFPDPNSPYCVPLCPLSDMNPMDCVFDTPSGCGFNNTEGLTVVVQAANGQRSRAALGTALIACPSTGSSLRKHTRVAFEDLQTAARCAASMPVGGYGADRFGTCPTPNAACGDPAAVPADACQALTFMTQTGMYTANVCTHSCTADADCGPRGVCDGGSCFERCGGPCALNCQVGFSCGNGVCYPNPP